VSHGKNYFFDNKKNQKKSLFLQRSSASGSGDNTVVGGRHYQNVHRHILREPLACRRRRALVFARSCKMPHFARSCEMQKRQAEFPAEKKRAQDKERAVGSSSGGGGIEVFCPA